MEFNSWSIERILQLTRFEGVAGLHKIIYNVDFIVLRTGFVVGFIPN